jgi:[acyl-carrier-protein] S-malonyltransferase
MVVPRRAFLFPGQGAQYVGMGQEIARRYPEADRVLAEAEAALGFALRRLLFEGPESELARTEITQPAILAVSLAVLEVLRRRGLEPDAALGLSLGEYGALVAADSLPFPDVVPLVRDRGRFMQEAVPEGRGGMLAVLGLDAEEVVAALAEVRSGVVELANDNAPGQLVVGGETAALAEARAKLLARGARRVVPLEVSAPFHTSLLRPAAERLRERLSAVRVAPPRLPVLANVTALPYPADADEVRRLLVAQVDHPVRLAPSLRRLLDDGFEVFCEIGPGKVLSGFVRRLDRQARVFTTDTVADLEALLAAAEEVC